MSNKINTEEEYFSIYHYYQKIASFTNEHNELSYHQLDNFIINNLSLFTIENSFDFEMLEKRINKINEAMVAINNIFKHPLLHLKEEDIVMPVEAVNKMDNTTFNHIYSHSELWEDLQDKKIKPSKLLTKIHEDNYGIYENLVFCNIIDRILSFVRHNLRILQDFIITKQSIDINILQRHNHLYYLLALGKLHIGYVRWYDNFSEEIQTNFMRLNEIYDNITNKLNRPVYKKNHKRPKDLKIKKTNILLMHKDYHKIYLLSKFFNKKEEKPNEELSIEQLNELNKGYFDYCEILMIFTIKHFNFNIKEDQKIILDNLKLNFIFKNWEIELTTNLLLNTRILNINMKADKEYKIVFIPLINLSNAKDIYDTIDATLHADEYIICSPFENEYPSPICFLSITNLESFRRIQQIILRGMVLSDSQRKECPFCQHELHFQYEEVNPTYACNHCKNVIVDTYCIKAQKPYSYTYIKNFKNNYLKIEDFNKEDLWIYHRKAEAQMFYRNITVLNDYKEAICPYCGKVH